MKKGLNGDGVTRTNFPFFSFYNVLLENESGKVINFLHWVRSCTPDPFYPTLGGSLLGGIGVMLMTTLYSCDDNIVLL